MQSALSPNSSPQTTSTSISSRSTKPSIGHFYSSTLHTHGMANCLAAMRYRSFPWQTPRPHGAILQRVENGQTDLENTVILVILPPSDLLSDEDLPSLPAAVHHFQENAKYQRTDGTPMCLGVGGHIAITIRTEAAEAGARYRGDDRKDPGAPDKQIPTGEVLVGQSRPPYRSTPMPLLDWIPSRPNCWVGPTRRSLQNPPKTLPNDENRATLRRSPRNGKRNSTRPTGKNHSPQPAVRTDTRYSRRW